MARSFEIYAAHRRSLLQQAAAEDAARTAVHESSDTVRSRKAPCQAPPDNRETGDKRLLVGEIEIGRGGLWLGEPNHGHQADVSCASSSVTEG